MWKLPNITLLPYKIACACPRGDRHGNSSHPFQSTLPKSFEWRLPVYWGNGKLPLICKRELGFKNIHKKHFLNEQWILEIHQLWLDFTSWPFINITKWHVWKVAPCCKTEPQSPVVDTFASCNRPRQISKEGHLKITSKPWMTEPERETETLKEKYS